MFCDLNYMITNKIEPKQYTTNIVAVNGIPIQMVDGKNTLLSQEVNVSFVRKLFLEGLGLGAVLTYKNPKGKTLLQFGEMCLKLGHTWTFHNLSLTICYKNAPISVRNAFAFDTNFKLSWVESEINDETVTFTATGSLKSWKKIADRFISSDFNFDQRLAFGNAKIILASILPELFETKE